MARDTWSQTPWRMLDETPARPPLPAAPRRVPWSTAWALRTHGVPATIGFAFMGMGGLMASAMLAPIDMATGPLAHMIGESTPGTVTAVRETNVRVNEEEVFAIEATYEGAGRKRTVTSYTVHPDLSANATVPVRYLGAFPELAVVEGYNSASVPLWVAPFMMLFPLVGLGLAGGAARRGSTWVKLLETGVEAEGTLISSEPTGTRINDEAVLALTFHFKDGAGDTWPAVARAVDTERLTDEASERVLYLRDDPSVAIVVDEIPEWLMVDGRGFGPAPSSVRMGVILRVGGVLGALALGMLLRTAVS